MKYTLTKARKLYDASKYYLMRSRHYIYREPNYKAALKYAKIALNYLRKANSLQRRFNTKRKFILRANRKQYQRQPSINLRPSITS